MQEYLNVITTYLEKNYIKELLTFIGGVFSVVLYFYVFKIKKKKKSFLQEAVKILYISTLFLIFTLTEQFKDIYLSSAIFKNLYLFFLAYEVINLTYDTFKIKSIKLKSFVNILLFVNIFLLLMLDITHNFSLPYGENYNLVIFLKLIISMPFLITFFTLTMKATIRISIENKLLKLIISKIFYVANVVFAILTILWVSGVFEITVKIIIAFVLFSILTVLFIVAVFFVNDYINKKLHILVENFPDLKKRVDTILFIIYLFSIYILFSVLFKGHLIIDRLKSFYIVKTDVLSISIYSLILAVIFYIFIINLIILTKILIRYIQYKKKKEFEPSPIEAIIYNFGVLLASIIALSMLGITWKVLLPLIGALGIGAGFGLQSIINNYISGFILIFNRKVEIGDVIEIQGKAGGFLGNQENIIFGIVTDIGVINTVIETVDGISVAVPNSKFVSDNIINYTLSDNLVRMRIPFKIPYDAPKEKVEKILLEVLSDFDRFIVRYPKPQVMFFSIKDYYNEYVLMVWIDARNWKKIIWLRSEMYKKAFERLQQEGIKVPVISVEIENGGEGGIRTLGGGKTPSTP